MEQKVFERKVELLEAALNEFTLKSYEEASLNTIIKNAGISKGTYYYHFADKQALYLYLLKTASRLKWEFITNNAEKLDSFASEQFFEQIKIQAQLGAAFAKKFPKYDKLGRMLIKERGSNIYKTALEILGGEDDSVLAAMIDRAIANGEFKSGYSKEFLLKTITYLLNGFNDVFMISEDTSLEEVLSDLELYIEFMRHGIER